MTIRQFAQEKVEEYARRFKKLLRKVNGGTAGAVLPPTLQVRMFLYGLSPIITPLVATENPATLEEAINRAKLVETGYNYVPTKQIGFSTSVATKENPTIRDIIATEQTNDVDSLADQLQKLTLNYANLASAMLAQPQRREPVSRENLGRRFENINRNRNNQNRDRRTPITCFNCEKEGHIIRECPERRSDRNNNRFNRNQNQTHNFQRTRFKTPQDTRRVNYIDDYYYSEEEYELYNNETQSESKKENRLRKRVRTGEEMDENEDYIQLTTPETSEPENIPKKKTPPKKEKTSRKSPKFRMKPAPIETVSEFDIAQYIRDLPCGLSVGQASANIPKYRTALQKSIRRTREANYIGRMEEEETAPTTAARCKILVNGMVVNAIIDSGASTSIVMKKLARKLGFEINKPSKLVIVTANGTKVRSLGEISEFTLELKGREVDIPVQVLESSDEVLILGNDWLKRARAVLDWEKSILTVKIEGRKIALPISCTRINKLQVVEESDSESEIEYEEEELEEAAVYFSDLISDTSESDLEFNPWVDHVTENELSSEEEEESTNPATMLAEVAFVEEKKKLNLGPLTDQEQELFAEFTNTYRDICAKSQTDIGRTDLIQHKINTGDARPIALPAYRLNPQKKEFLRKEIANMEEVGIIRKSKSPWAFPVVIVSKKDGTHRLCIDYRKLNKVTKPDAFPLPRIDDMLESFGQAKWFITLDLASGYWQVGMNPEDVEKTAFRTPYGLYEFLVMPFGLSYAPGTFQRLMNHILHEYLNDFVAVYLDDIIIFTKGTFEQHIEQLAKVFQKLREAKLKIKISKCHFCLPNIHFLGHVVGRDGIHPDPEKIDKVKNYSEPKNLTQLRAALGLFSYYRKFVKDLSKIARPLYALLKKDVPFQWKNQQQEAFNYLKETLTKAPILSYPEFDKPFVIFTDASKIGLGAVLSQKRENGKEYVIAYASRSLNQAEKNYSVTEQECLAVIWAIKYFQHYLGMCPFELITDHSALKWLQTAKMPSGRRARWIMELQQYDFTIKHRPGKQNANADALSRIEEHEEEVSCYMIDQCEPVEYALSDLYHRQKRRKLGEREEASYLIKAASEYLKELGPAPGESENEEEPETLLLIDENDEPMGYLVPNGYFNLNESEDESDKESSSSEESRGSEEYRIYQEWMETGSYVEEHDENDPEEPEGEFLELIENGVATISYAYSGGEVLDLYRKAIQIKQVIAGQPIQRGGSKCSETCDMENHHTHTYCKTCKRNLLTGTIKHECKWGFKEGEIHPEMNPEYLINHPWWSEPLSVLLENNTSYLRQLLRCVLNLPFYEIDLTDNSDLIAPLD